MGTYTGRSFGDVEMVATTRPMIITGAGNHRFTSYQDSSSKSYQKLQTSSILLLIKPEEPSDLDDPIVDDKGMKMNDANTVHKFIAKRMAQTLIVKLLGRRLSHLTMSNRLQVSWKTKQTLQIIDLENDYFSVKFQDDDEYLYALSGGLWMIFGHYLTVQSWTPSFSIDQHLPQSLLVWI
ncbi:hypothetical protein Goklo_023981 [Gossypium klotzschianum]|uniref:DUF4283 domain-containing protein n=1 Tax=Gossypium klotzschianum TaxID=34286 RepID=A0A7J8WE91_9ROSI|nr:hypothetical protein [Gossypium klotzschianum]